ncbi:hypothetical protein FRB99_007359 [Tulasnella sp. 403]|nr:hypothetical protein FRB99_007359 [Tulasnella sp. 403]
MSQALTLSFQFGTATLLPTATVTSSFDKPPPSVLVLSPIPQVDKVLSDVPFFCTGVLAFAMIIFSLATRRLNQPLSYIVSSAIAAFIGGVVDLAAVLNTTSSNFFALLVAREMAYAASVGLRFLFFWVFAGRRPEIEVISLPPLSPRAAAERPTRDDNSTPSSKTHSASWARLGLAGVAVQYTTFFACFMIMILQTIWRFGALFKLSKFIALYRADAWMEIAISVVFIAKLCTNAYLSSRRPWWKIWRTTGPLVFALLVQAGVPIGNLIVVRFSECCLGRLLQALEIYIVLVTLLISVFLDAPSHRLRPGNLATSYRTRTSSFQGLAIRNSFRPFRASLVNSLASPNNNAGPSNSLSPTKPPTIRQTTAERFTNWVAARVSGDKNSDDQVRLWDQTRINTDVEKGGSPELKTASDDLSPLASKEQKVSYGNVSPQVVTLTSVADRMTGAGPAMSVRPSIVRTVKTTKEAVPMKAPSKRSSYSVDEGRPSITRVESLRSSIEIPQAPVERTESPIYGLDGIIRNLASRNALLEMSSPAPETMLPDVEHSPALTESTVPSLASPNRDSLARQQRELEQSVRSLQLFSPTATVASTITAKPRRNSVFLEQPAPVPELPKTKPAPGSRPATGNRSTPSTANGESISASLNSEFSLLSNFPSPPAALKAFMMETTSEKSEPRTSLEWDSRSSSAAQPREPPSEPVAGPSKPTATPRPARTRRLLDEVMSPVDSINVDDIPFTLVPPRMPAVASETHQRQMSLQSTRGSDFSIKFDGSKSHVDDGGRRLDVTSFIGGFSKTDGVPHSPSHARQDSDKSGKTMHSSTILEEDEVRTSTDVEAITTKTAVRRTSTIARARLVDRNSMANSRTAESDRFSEDSIRPEQSAIPASTTVATPPAVASPSRRQANALPFSPRPPASTTGRTVAQAPLSKARNPGLQISSPIMPTEPSKSFERPRPPPLALGALPKKPSSDALRK